MSTERLRVLIAATSAQIAERTLERLRRPRPVLQTLVRGRDEFEAALGDPHLDAVIVVDSLAELSIEQALALVREHRPELPVTVVGESALRAAPPSAGLSIDAGRAAAPAGFTALARSEARLRSAVEDSAEAVTLVDADATVVYRNAQAAALLGVKTDEDLGRQAFAGVHRDDVEEVRRAFRAVSSERGARQRSNVRYRRKDGSWLHLDVLAVNLLDDSKVQAIVLHLRDVTEQVLANAALRNSEARFEAIADTIADGIFIADRDGRLLTSNRAFAAHYPISRSGSIVGAFADPEDWRRWAQGVLSDDDEHRVEALLLGAGGSERWAEIRGRRFVTGDSVVCLATVRDVQVERDAKIVLERSEGRWRHLLAVSPDGVIVHQDGRITWLNESARMLLGLATAEEALGRDQLDFVAPEYHAEIHARRAELGQEHHAMPRMEEELVRPDGSRVPVEVVATRFDDVGGPAVLLIVRDISARREQAQRLERLTRIRTMLSSSSAMVLRARTRESLLREVCRVAVEEGGYVMGWIGLREAPRSELRIATTCHRNREAAGLSGAEDRLLRAVSMEAVANGEIAVRSNVQLGDTDVATREEGRSHDAEAQSVAAVPFGEGRARGVLALVADRPHAFDPEEMGLLRQVAEELAFALEGFTRDEQLDFMAYHDPLTGLANRSLLLDRLDQLCAASVPSHLVALVYADIHRFRVLNEYLGRAGGDELLRMLGKRLESCFPGHATVARVGSNAFAVACPSVASAEEIAHRLERARTSELEREFTIGTHRLAVSVHMGVALYPHDAVTGEALLRNAEAAWNTAVERQEAFTFYAPEMNAWVSERLILENELRDAVDNDEFIVHYQPRLALASGELIGVEALLRWNHRTRGVVLPAGVIGALEQTGLIHRVGRWLFRTVTDDWRRWSRNGWLAPRIAVNVSAMQLRRNDFVAEVRTIIGAEPRDQPALDIEITESVFMQDLQGSIATLDQIRALGLQVAIDDFGTGYSSLSYLARLPIDIVKVDKSFTAEIGAGRSGLAVVATIVHLARALGLQSVAEGVETREQARELRDVHCDEVQGFLIAAAMPVEKLEVFLRDPQRRRELAMALGPSESE